MSSSYRSPSVGATFRHFLNGFLQTDAVPFRDVLTATQIEQAAALAVDAARPISDQRGSAEFRRHLVRVLTRRTLAIALERARG